MASSLKFSLVWRLSAVTETKTSYTQENEVERRGAGFHSFTQLVQIICHTLYQRDKDAQEAPALKG